MTTAVQYCLYKAVPDMLFITPEYVVGMYVPGMYVISMYVCIHIY